MSFLLEWASYTWIWKSDISQISDPLTIALYTLWVQISLFYVCKKYNFLLFSNPQYKIDFRGFRWVHAESWISTEPSREFGRELFVFLFVNEYLILQFGTLKFRKFLSSWKSHITHYECRFQYFTYLKFTNFCNFPNPQIKSNSPKSDESTQIHNFAKFCCRAWYVSQIRIMLVLPYIPACIIWIPSIVSTTYACNVTCT